MLASAAASDLTGTAYAFQVGTVEGEVEVFFGPDGVLCAVRVQLEAPHGAPLRAMLTAWADAVSIGLAAGIPLSAYLPTIERVAFEPDGLLRVDGAVDPAQHHARSVLDAVAAVLRRVL